MSVHWRVLPYLLVYTRKWPGCTCPCVTSLARWSHLSSWCSCCGYSSEPLTSSHVDFSHQVGCLRNSEAIGGKSAWLNFASQTRHHWTSRIWLASEWSESVCPRRAHTPHFPCLCNTRGYDHRLPRRATHFASVSRGGATGSGEQPARVLGLAYRHLCDRGSC